MSWSPLRCVTRQWGNITRLSRENVPNLDAGKKLPYNGTMTTREKILSEIERYLARTGTSERRFGIEVTRDHNLVKRLRDGSDITTGTADMIRDYMAKSAKKLRPKRNAS